MIIGYDVVKVGKGKKKFVMAASYDANYSKFYTEECIVDSESEVGPVNSLLRNCLNYFSFHYKNAILPFNFIIYRSGVSEKEKDLILQHEVKSVINLLSGNLTQECYKEGYTAKFTYIIVNKKTESKFFEYSNGNVNNPKEGTVIDSQAVSPGAYEFYIQPQFVNSGTATPTHFQVIYDSIGFPLEDIEDITYKQCYYYWNWSGAIREPAALKFAEVANKFSSTYLQNYVRDRLKNSPYYI
jgi:aubergine-like protein